MPPPQISMKKVNNWLSYKPQMQLFRDKDTMELLDREKQWKQKLEATIKRAETIEHQRQVMLHKRWTESVAVPIKKTFQAYVDGQSSAELNRRKRENLEQYLEFSNRKGAAYLNHYDPSVYDPYYNRRDKRFNQVTLPGMKDPLQHIYEEHIDVNRQLLCDTGRMLATKGIGDRRLKKLEREKLPKINQHPHMTGR